MIFALLTLLSALSLAGVAGWFSIIGITAIYAAMPFHAIVMGIVLEAGKLVTTSWLYRNWAFADWKLKTPLILFTIALMLATSIGVFGFLSKAHLEQGAGTVDNTARIERLDQQIAREKSVITDNEKVIGQLDGAINSYIGKDRTDKSVAVRRSQAPQRKQLRDDIDASQKRIDGFSEEKFKLTSEVRKLQLEVGPIRYIAELFYGTEGDGAKNIELAVRMFTLLIVSTLDPLAVILLIAANHTILRRQNEKKQKTEAENTIREMGGQTGVSSNGQDFIEAPKEHKHEIPANNIAPEDPQEGHTPSANQEIPIPVLQEPLDVLNEDQDSAAEEHGSDAEEIPEKQPLVGDETPTDVIREILDEGSRPIGPTYTWPKLPQKVLDEESQAGLEKFQLGANYEALPIIRSPIPSHVSYGQIAEETPILDLQDETEVQASVPDVDNAILRELRGYTAGPHFVPQKLNEEEKPKVTEASEVEGKELTIQESPAPSTTSDTFETASTIEEIQEVGQTEDPSQEDFESPDDEAIYRTKSGPRTLSWINEFKKD